MKNAMKISAVAVLCFTKGDEGPGPLGHFHRLAFVHEVDKLAHFDVEGALPAGYRFDRRLHAFDVATVIRTPDVDHGGEAAPEFVGVIGDVRGEIGPASVRLAERPVDVVAELGCPK